MQRKIINELPDFPASRIAASIKDIITKLLISIPQEKAVPKENKQLYSRVLKQIEWGISKVSPHWPEEIQRMVDNLRKHLLDFQSATNQSKNSSFICGSNKGKDIGHIFNYIMGYEQMFRVVAHYQDKNLRHDLVSNVLNLYEKQNNPRHQSTKATLPDVQEKSSSKTNEQINQNCQNCKLYLSLSLQPNGSLAKNLLKTLPNTEWLMGILYEQGKVFPQDTAKAAQFYEKAATKNNPDSIYRLGSLNQRGDYGRPYEYLNMWKKAAEMGNLQAITDMGFLYQKGLVDDDTGKTIVEKNSAKAHEYYLRAAKDNFPRGLNNLGSFYQLDPSYKNKEKSIQCFNKAVDAGYVKAMFNLALCYSQGFVGVSDPQRAKQLFKRAADLGDHYSKLFYVDILLNGDTSTCSEDQLEEAHKFCRQMIAEEDDRAEAYYFLGIMHQSGLGAPQQPKTAILYFTKAAKLNYVHGLIKLADCYRTGFGIEQDHKQALKLYEQASKTKPEALVSIGAIYEQGSDLIKRNYETAFKYYYQACNRNVVEAFNKLGNCYRMGRGCKKDEEKAREYFSKFDKLNCSQSYMSKTNLMQSQSSVGQSSQVYVKRRM